MTETVGLLFFVAENSHRYPKFLALKNDLIALGLQHDPQTFTQFVFHLTLRCTPHAGLNKTAFINTSIKLWNKFKSLSVLSSCEKFYTTKSFN